MTSTAGICALIDNFFPVVHVARMRRGAPTPLEKLRYGCRELGFQAGVEVDERRDFQCVLYRWARLGGPAGGSATNYPKQMSWRRPWFNGCGRPDSGS